MTNLKALLLASTCAGLALVSTTARAADAPQKSTDEVATVVVTAQKREQKLQDVPMGITVAGAEQLDRQQVTQIHDLDRISPAVSFVDGAPGGGAGIRGIATQTFTPSAEASVGVVVDGVPQGNVNESNLFDVERVEVLRGPQGTLFGQSASAGVINIVTRAPKIGEFSGRLHVDYADDGSVGSKYGEQVVQGVVNLPLTATSAVRVAAFENRVDGIERDSVSGKIGVNDDTGFRIRYLNDLTSNLRMNLIVDYDVDHEAGPNLFVFSKAVNPTTISALAACGITASASNTEVCANYPTANKTTNGGVSAQFDYQLGDYTLTSITSFRQRNEDPNRSDIVSLKGVFPQLYSPNQIFKLRQASQEFRITSPTGHPLEWTVGAFASRFTNWTGGLPFSIVAPDSFAPPFLQVTDNPVAKGDIGKNYSTTVAVFGDATYHFNDKLSVFGGLRFNRESVGDLQVYSLNIHPVSAVIGPLPTIAIYNNVPETISTTVNNVSERIGVQYKVQTDLMVYGTVSTGFKGPQANDTVFGVTPTIVRPEKPTAFEIGAKGQVGGVGVDVNLFYDKVKDYQGQKCVINPNLVCGGANVPEVTTKGLEIDVFGRPIHNLTLNGGFIYNPVKYPSNYIGSDGTNLGGTQITGAPVTKFTLSGEYLVDLPDDYQGFIDFDTTYKSKIHVYPSNLPIYDLGAHWVTGARVGLKLPDGRTRVSLYVRNIANTPEPVNIYPGPLNATGQISGDTQSIVGKQGLRIVGLSLDSRF